MVQPSFCLLLECQAQLPERLDWVRGGYFTYNDGDHSYTSRQYSVIPKSFADGCVWTFSLEGGASNETLCTTTYFSSECNGWLATGCGACAAQHWTIGGYRAGASVPMRFIDASVKLAPRRPITDMIQQLTAQIANIREDYKKDAGNNNERHEGILRAICQRHDTDMTSVLRCNAQLVTESRAMMENHVHEALQIENATLEERNKMHAASVKTQLEHFQASMEGDATYRDTLYTEHQLAVEKRLQDAEVRASDKQDKHYLQLQKIQEEHLGMVKDQIVKSDEIGARVRDLDGKVTHIEANMREKIVQAMLELIQRHQAFQLEDRAVIQLVDAPHQDSTVEVDIGQDVMRPAWSEGDCEGTLTDKAEDEQAQDSASTECVTQAVNMDGRVLENVDQSNAEQNEGITGERVDMQDSMVTIDAALGEMEGDFEPIWSNGCDEKSGADAIATQPDETNNDSGAVAIRDDDAHPRATNPTSRSAEMHKSTRLHERSHSKSATTGQHAKKKFKLMDTTACPSRGRERGRSYTPLTRRKRAIDISPRRQDRERSRTPLPRRKRVDLREKKKNYDHRRPNYDHSYRR